MRLFGHAAGMRAKCASMILAKTAVRMDRAGENEQVANVARYYRQLPRIADIIAFRTWLDHRQAGHVKPAVSIVSRLLFFPTVSTMSYISKPAVQANAPSVESMFQQIMEVVHKSVSPLRSVLE